MKALMTGLLCLALTPCSADDLSPANEVAAELEPAMALIDASAERLHVALDLSGLVGASNGLIVNMLIANDEQARADASIASLVARLPKGLLLQSLRKGLKSAAAAHGLDLRLVGSVPEPSIGLIPRIKGSSEFERALLVRFGTNVVSGNSFPIAITPDFRQLRISLDVERLMRRNTNFNRQSRQTVTVLSAPASVHLGALAQDAWAANDGALLAQAIEHAVQRAASLALAAPAAAEPEIGKDEHVDVVTALGGERYRGRLIERAAGDGEGDIVIARPDGDLLVVPVLRVLSPLAQPGNSVKRLGE